MLNILLQIVLFSAYVLWVIWLIQRTLDDRMSWILCLVLVGAGFVVLWLGTPDLVLGVTGST